MNALLSISSTTQEKFSIHIVTGKGGGGHYATYHAIRAIAEQKQLPWQFHVVDMDDIMASMTQQKQVLNAYQLLGSSVADLYNLMLKSGWTWLWFLQICLNKLLVKLNYDAGVKFFEQYWREHPPDMVVSVVTMCNKVLAEALQKVKPGTPYVTVPIDFADYPPGFWFEPQTDNYTVCATEKALEQARSLGVKEELIVPSSGMVIHPRFYEPMDCNRADERQRLGLDPDCLTGVVLFGGNGSQVMLDIAKRLESFGDRLQLIFLCGRNEKLAATLKENQGKQKRLVTTFTTDIPYYMQLADFFIGKPGPGSISEALAMKLPVITECNLSTLVHERYNAKWVREKEVGLVLRSFRHIEKAVEQFLDAPTFARYRANVESYNNRAVFELCDLLEKILATRDPTTVAELVEQVTSYKY
ncbi:MAG: UDP-N-acetylglucosamine--LPS N-acetylglucosamine transferase [Hydrococcus sp. Prado102]|jgi:1,2-diacylglycerol 3-beta-galactosyltransferase|nr:UDP-N-acetylglucosamine--LPS N-acetylglucosamine transferase [Hydrococcus sp. Prado102]